MKNGNGRTARPRTSAELKMAGTIHLALTPENIQQIAAGKETVLDLEGMEFIIQIESAKENKVIELAPWFEMDDAIVIIENSIRKNNPEAFGAQLPGYMEVDLVESEKRSLGFLVNPGQAKTLAQVLLQYVQAWDAVEALRAESVRA